MPLALLGAAPPRSGSYTSGLVGSGSESNLWECRPVASQGLYFYCKFIGTGARLHSRGVVRHGRVLGADKGGGPATAARANEQGCRPRGAGSMQARGNVWQGQASKGQRRAAGRARRLGVAGGLAGTAAGERAGAIMAGVGGCLARPSPTAPWNALLGGPGSAGVFGNTPACGNCGCVQRS